MGVREGGPDGKWLLVRLARAYHAKYKPWKLDTALGPVYAVSPRIVFAVPEDGDREGVLLRYRQTNPPRGLTGRDKDLVEATREVVRSFQLGRGRP